MKKVILALFLMLAFSITANAQYTTDAYVRARDNGLTVSFAGSLDSTGGTHARLTSGMFDLGDYDNVDYFTVYYLLTASVGSPLVTVTLEASEDNSTFTTIDTLVNAVTSETPTWSAFTLSGTRASYYDIFAVSDSGGRPTDFEIKIMSPGKDAVLK